jgi:photosystem II stability/assembly factor-like uncharacterized protein
MRMSKILFCVFFVLISVSISFGQSYQWQTTSINTNTDNQRFDDVFFLNENLGWAANGYHAAVYKTTNGGVTWNKQIDGADLAPNLYFRNITFLNENVGFLGSLISQGSSSAKVYKTIDGGATWTEINNITPYPQAICGLDAVGSNTVYGCGAYFQPAYIIKSSDSGATWQYIDMAAYATALVEVKFISKTTGYAAGKNANGGNILKTTDGGLTWTEIYNSNKAGEYVWKLQVLNTNKNVIFGAVESVSPNLGKLISTKDAGVNWVEKNAPETDIQAVGFISESHGWMGGHSTGIFETKDGGTTWTDLEVGGNLNRVFVINTTTVFASGTSVYKYTDKVLDLVDDLKVHSRKPLVIKMLENPIKNSLKFTVTYTNNDHMLIELYDNTGKFVKQLSREDIYGENQTKNYNFSVKDLSSGLYFLNFHNNTGRQSIKFVKI